MFLLIYYQRRLFIVVFFLIYPASQTTTVKVFFFYISVSYNTQLNVHNSTRIRVWAEPITVRGHCPPMLLVSSDHHPNPPLSPIDLLSLLEEFWFLSRKWAIGNLTVSHSALKINSIQSNTQDSCKFLCISSFFFMINNISCFGYTTVSWIIHINVFGVFTSSGNYELGC